MGAGLNSSMAKMRDKATSDLKRQKKKKKKCFSPTKPITDGSNGMCFLVPDLCPPLSSPRFSFQVVPKATLNSRPSKTPQPWGGASLAVAPGNRVEKMDPKSLLTCGGEMFGIQESLTTQSEQKLVKR